MSTVRHWSGHETLALRTALRMGVQAFADHLSVAKRSVLKWEAKGADARPRPDSQALLDAALARADPQVHTRFEQLLAEPIRRPPGYDHRAGPSRCDYETWADDLHRASSRLAQQDFPFAASLIHRWTRRCDPHRLDASGLYLYGRSLILLGDLQQDQGVIQGPRSAQHTYQQALAIFHKLDNPRRVAGVELGLTVLEEMAGNVETAAQGYKRLSADDRLSPRDRTRAQLWIGTALSKAGHNEHAQHVITPTIQAFDELEEPDDWSSAHQKLALAYRGSGNLNKALHHIDIALSHQPRDMPMKLVQATTAHAHILCSDRRTANEGVRLLDAAETLATDRRLGHQLRSIQRLRRSVTPG